MKRDAKRIIIEESDGSLYPDNRVMAASWIVATDEEHFTSACTIIQHVSSCSSYRAELEGTFRLLKHIKWLGLTPEEVRHWCDNKGTVKTNKLLSIPAPSDMLAPDADLILAIMALKQKLKLETKCRYISGHQDEKKRKIKSSKEKRKEKTGKTAGTHETNPGDRNQRRYTCPTTRGASRC